MKKIFTLFAALFVAIGIYAQDAPLYTAEAVYYVDDEYGEYCDVNFPIETLTSPATVEAYDGYVIVRSIAGVAGYDMMVEYDENENVVSVTPIKNGVEGETVESGWCQFYTGLDGNWKYMNAWLAEGYVNATSDAETQSGYVLLYGYNAKNEYTYYYIYWGYEDEGEEVVIWENDGTNGMVSWSGEYRFCNSEHMTGEEICAVPMDQWEVLRTSDFYLDFKVDKDWPMIRVTTGWWSVSLNEDDFTYNSNIFINNEDGTYTLPLNLTTNEALLADLDEKHLLFTGDGYTPLKLYYYANTNVEDAIKAPVAAIKKGDTFNLAGQKVDAQYKGIVIRNGKKMLQK